MPEATGQIFCSWERGRPDRLLSLLLLAILLLSLLPSAGCGDGDPEEIDRALEYVLSARSLLIDSGRPDERLLRGDTLREFLADYERDTFAPGPRSVRIETDCRPGILTVARNRHTVALCRLWESPHTPVIAIDLDTAVLRLARMK